MKMFIIGILVASAWSTVMLWLADTFDECHFQCYNLAGGPLTWVLWIFTIIISKFNHWKRYRNVASLVMDIDTKQIYHVDRIKVDDILEQHKNLVFAPTSKISEADRKKWDSYFNVDKDIMNTRYAPKAVWKKYPPLVYAPSVLTDKH